jgi:hypothetical protein
MRPGASREVGCVVRTVRFLVAGLAWLVAVAAAGAGRAAGVYGGVGQDDLTVLTPRSLTENADAGVVATLLADPEVLLALAAASVFLAVGFWGIRQGYDLLHRGIAGKILGRPY